MATKPACKPLQMARYAGRSGSRAASVSGHLRRSCSAWFCLKDMGNKCLCRNDTERVNPSWGQRDQFLKVLPRVLILSVVGNRKGKLSPLPNCSLISGSGQDQELGISVENQGEVCTTTHPLLCPFQDSASLPRRCQYLAFEECSKICLKFLRVWERLWFLWIYFFIVF